MIYQNERKNLIQTAEVANLIKEIIWYILKYCYLYKIHNKFCIINSINNNPTKLYIFILLYISIYYLYNYMYIK